MSDAKEPTRLYGKQTAEPNTCGSCFYYARRPVDLRYAPSGADLHSWCKFRFPPWLKTATGWNCIENSGDYTRVDETHTCSLWKPSGQTYVKDVLWTVKE